jgi:hypothetical protein
MATAIKRDYKKAKVNENGKVKNVSPKESVPVRN